MMIADLPPRLVCPLRLPFTSLRDVMDHCAQIPHQQLPEWRYQEYLRAGVMAWRNLTSLFDSLSCEDLSTIRWADIAEDVADLSTLARNPQ
jgi:hypothetical protein